MSATNINVITAGGTSVTMPARATVDQRRYMRFWLTQFGDEAGDVGVTAEMCGDGGDVRVLFPAGDGQLQQMLISATGGTHSGGPVATPSR
ncbi:hypothetical protein ACIA5G_51015 [Amycolatopsis sp. NPDC051758]|uniref:hypothetical protein n=1 Tax=Amycolatopsis sp. NPDC051758 TaxID=3363935 RepID=UPI003791E10D